MTWLAISVKLKVCPPGKSYRALIDIIVTCNQNKILISNSSYRIKRYQNRVSKLSLSFKIWKLIRCYDNSAHCLQNCICSQQGLSRPPVTPMFESNHVNRDSLFRLLSLIQFVECAAVDSDMTVIEPQLLPTENCSELSTFVNPMPLFFKVQAQLESRSFVGVPMSCGIGYHWLEMKAWKCSNWMMEWLQAPKENGCVLFCVRWNLSLCKFLSQDDLKWLDFLVDFTYFFWKDPNWKRSRKYKKIVYRYQDLKSLSMEQEWPEMVRFPIKPFSLENRNCLNRLNKVSSKNRFVMTLTRSRLAQGKTLCHSLSIQSPRVLCERWNISVISLHKSQFKLMELTKNPENDFGAESRRYSSHHTPPRTYHKPKKMTFVQNLDDKFHIFPFQNLP